MVNFSTILVAAVTLFPLGLAAPEKRAESEAIPGKYIVTLKKGVSLDTVTSHLGWVNATHKRSLTSYKTAGVSKTFTIGNWCAYAGEFPTATIDEIKKNNLVGTRGVPRQSLGELLTRIRSCLSSKIRSGASTMLKLPSSRPAP